MAHKDFSAESAENYEQKCLCVLAVDTSGSMYGDPIYELNKGLKGFHEDVKNDKTTADRLEFAIVSFDSQVKNILAPSLVDNFKMPRLQASGTTRLVDGVREAIAIVDARKAWYKSTGQPYFRPWIVLITDGAPNPDQDVHGLSQEIQKGADSKNFFFYGLGVKDADMNMLQQISTQQMPPGKLEGLKFTDFFGWLSASMAIVSSSIEGDTKDLPNPAAWMEGFDIS
ncbi:MAG: VWA domain-containing protein [Chloroflexota bacterium]